MKPGMGASVAWAVLALAVPGTFAQTAASPPSAGYYSCRTAEGRLITSDRPIMECMNREQRVHGPDGTVRRVIEAPLTPEQKKVREAERQRAEEEQARADENRRRDRTLLSSYSSAESIDLARKRALVEPNSGIAKSQSRIEQLRKERAALDAETEFYKGGARPADLDRKFRDNARALKYEEDLIARRHEEIRQIETRYAADKKRFAELTEGSGARR